MKRSHFETLKPLCPRCMRDRGRENPLKIGIVCRENNGSIEEGILTCPDTECLSEYPIIDGIPVLVADVRSYVSQNTLSIIYRNDLSETMESLIGDCCGPGSLFDVRRQHLSIYAFDHYGDIDPEESKNRDVLPGAILKLAQSFSLQAKGPVVDIGCSVGRTSFALAESLDSMVLGVDLNFDMLRVARGVLYDGVVRYPRRRVGLVYDKREFPAQLKGASHVDFWACDAAMMPFSAKTFSIAASFNVLDCLSSPYAHLCTIARILMPGGQAVISTPYDWSASATPVESWIGGHSQRSENSGKSEAAVREILKGRTKLRLVSEIESVPWTVRLHDRSVMHYDVHIMLVQSES